MTLIAEYRRQAAKVEKLAECAFSDEHRQAILKIATLWRDVADQRDRMLEDWDEGTGALPTDIRPTPSKRRTAALPKRR